MKKYTTPAIKQVNIEAQPMLDGSINNEMGNGVQLSKRNDKWEDDDFENDDFEE